MSLPTPYYQTPDGAVTLYHGDCREILPEIPAGSVDLVLTDPPYGKVVDSAWDHEWTNRRSMLPACRQWLRAMVPVLKPNGTLYWFAWPSLAGRIESIISVRLNVLAHIVWRKPAPRAQKASAPMLRAPIPETERIIMAEHYGADNMALGDSGYVAKCDELRGFVFEPLRKYLADEWAAAGLTRKDAEEATGTQMAGHWFSRVQWALPTAEHYATLQRRANEHLRREYEDLRREYEDLRREYEDLRRFFELTNSDQKTDIWTFAPDYNRSAHPTQKPLGMMQYMVRISCRRDGLVLDPFAGSGTTLLAARNLGRRAIGIEISEEYCEIAAGRLGAVHAAKDSEPLLAMMQAAKEPRA